MHEPVVTVALETPPAPVDRSLSRAAITERSRRADQKTDAASTIGRTEAEFSVDVNPNARAEPDGHGHFCASVIGAFVIIKWKVTKFLASELEPGSCMYRVVEGDLEQYAVLIQQSRAENEDRIRKAILSEMRQPVIASKAEEGKQSAKENLTKAISNALKTVDADMNLQRAKLRVGLPEGRKLCGVAAYEAAFAN